MKAATITQPLALAAPAVDDQILRPLNPRILTVDIVLPVLSEAHVLERSVTKLYKYLASNLPYRWCIVIADNGSTDDTATIARWLAERHPEIRLLQLSEKRPRPCS
ncbi:glycosyltransferase [TM7 phylum sp. oral taxon 349]|nr:glycosyltransferase [TM7 phylum sp. oral taxon 349]TWP21479.1 glycosyltransferase [TM7 phylum sp. oral taxon 346]